MHNWPAASRKFHGTHQPRLFDLFLGENPFNDIVRPSASSLRMLARAYETCPTYILPHEMKKKPGRKRIQNSGLNV
jgi:hypothetical protein